MAQLSSGYQLVILPAELASGQLALTMVVKRTFRVTLESSVVEPLPDAEQPPPLLEDRYDEGDPTTAAPTLEADVAPEKPRVDVIVLGKAYAPGGKPQAEFECTLQVGRKRETLHILGPRKVLWQPPKKENGKLVPQTPKFTQPEPIAELALSLKNAYGGWTWLIADDETLRIQREVAQAMAAEAAQKAAEQPKTQAKTEGKKPAQKDEKKPQTDKEKLRLGDGSEGYDEHGVRLWNASASNDGTAVLSLEEFQRQELAEQAKKLRKTAAVPQQMQDEQRLEQDDAEVLTEAEWAKIRAEEAAKVVTAPQEKPEEVVVNSDGTRVLAVPHAGPEWDADLRGQVQAEDDRTAGARKKAAEERKKAEDAALAEYPHLPCPTNPYGVGFCVSNHPKVLERLKLPQIEHPHTRLTPQDLVRNYLELDKVPLPAGFSTLPRQAEPRISLAGPLPSDLGDWQEKTEAQKKKLDLQTREGREALKVLEARQKPRQMQAGFHNTALPTMQMHEVRGDEEVTLGNLSKNGRIFFKLPGRQPVAELDRGRGVERQDLRLDTVVVDAEKLEVALVWRAQFSFKSWNELGEYPRLVGHVLDWDLEDRRKQQATQRRGDGTQVLDVSAMPFDVKIREPKVAVKAPDDALELPKEGSYLQADQAAWEDNAEKLAEQAAEKRKAEQAELAWRAQKAAALEDLAVQESAEAARRAEIGAAVAAGKPIPPAGAKKK